MEFVYQLLLADTVELTNLIGHSESHGIHNGAHSAKRVVFQVNRSVNVRGPVLYVSL